METKLGKIMGISLGFGGYDDAMFGVSVSLGNGSWGVSDFRGTWGHKPGKYAKWTEEDQIRYWGESIKWLHDLMKDANVTSLTQLKNIPVEITLKDNMLKSWRILTEVIK